MLKKKKILFAVPVLLIVAAGAVYMLGIYPPKKVSTVKPKVAGTLVQLPNEFVINLAGGHYGKLSIALELSSPPPVAVASSSSGADSGLPQDAVVRAVITDQLTGVQPSSLIDRASRNELLDKLLADLKKQTDEPITKVLITDLAVQ